MTRSKNHQEEIDNAVNNSTSPRIKKTGAYVPPPAEANDYAIMYSDEGVEVCEAKSFDEAYRYAREWQRDGTTIISVHKIHS